MNVKLEPPLDDDPLEEYYHLQQIAAPHLPRRRKGSDEVFMLGIVLFVVGLGVLISFLIWIFHR